MNSQELRALQEAYNQVYELDEAEGSYGQTPKATAAYGALANKRRNTPASEYPQRGAKNVAVKSAEKHMSRSENPDAGDRGKKSTKPYWTSDSRKGMTQKDRNWRRGADEYGHSGYDGEGGGGSLPKGKKLERQIKRGVSAESFDLYDIILSHLLDEGYAETPEAAEAIMVNMSEEWRESIVEDIAGNQYTPNPIGNAIKTGAGLIKKVLGNSSSSGTSTKPGDGKPYQDGPLWDGPKTPTKPPSKKGPANRDEPLW